jgi:hypothetical protein
VESIRNAIFFMGIEEGPVFFQLTGKVIVQVLRKGKACDGKAWKYKYFKAYAFKGMAVKGNAS